MYRYGTRTSSFEQLMASCPLHPRSVNSKREARRLVLLYCDTKSLLALRLVSKDISTWVNREESRFFREIHITLDLGGEYLFTPASWVALQRVGKFARRVIFTLVVRNGRRKIEFKHGYNNSRSRAVRASTSNPLPEENLFDSQGRFSLVGSPVPILGGVFKHFYVNEDEPDGLFKRVFDLTPNMHSLCLRDQVIWEKAYPERLEAEWGRTLVDEALIYIRCQFEEWLLARLDRLHKLEVLSRLEEEAQIEEVARFKKQAVLGQLAYLEEFLLTQIENMSRLNLIAQYEELTRIQGVVKQKGLVQLGQLTQLAESLLTRRKELAQLKNQARLPKLLEMQVGSPLALWHFRTSPGTIRALNITLPAAILSQPYERKQIVKRGIYGFLAGFSGVIESLSIAFATFQRPGAPAVAVKDSVEIGNAGNPLTYDLDPDYGGGEKIFYPILTKLSLKNMQLTWEGGLKVFFTERAQNCIDLVLTRCTFTSHQGCREFYELFELQNAQKLINSDVPLVLTRKLRLPGEYGFGIG